MADTSVPYFKSASTVKSEEDEERQLNAELNFHPPFPCGPNVQHVQISNRPSSSLDSRSKSPYIRTISPMDSSSQDSSFRQTPSPGQVHLIGRPFAKSPPPPGVQPISMSVQGSTTLIRSDSTSGSSAFKSVPMLSSAQSGLGGVMTTIKQEKTETVKKVIIIQPGEDAEQATARAMQEITESLNKQAAEQLAEGYSPEKETVIEITRIRAPEQTYPDSSRESIIKTQGMKPPSSGPAVVKLTRGTTPTPRSNSRGPTPQPTTVKRVPVVSRGPSPFPQHLLQRVQSPCIEIHAGVKSQFTVIKPICSPVPSAALGASKVSTASAVLGAINTSQSMSTTVRHSGSSRPAILRNSTAKAVTFPSTSTATIATSLGSSSDSDSGISESNTSAKLNDSLTNIQWLGTMSSEKLTPPHRDLRIYPSEKQMEKISRECGKKKRPPYSYMHLIQMAICSKPDRKMTLKEIYRWIEEKFPYYGHASNQGWKNSIRHNLSLYDIFVREKATVHGKSGSSYWTLRPDIPVKSTKASRQVLSLDSGHITPIGSITPTPSSPLIGSTEALANSCTSVSLLTGGKSKKGLVPIQPKPPAVQTYALIPIQSGVPLINNQQVMVSQVPVSSPTLSDNNGHDAVDQTPKQSRRKEKAGQILKSNLKRQVSAIECDGPVRKHVKIAAKTETEEILSDSLLGKSLSCSLDTSELRNQFSKIQMDSGLGLSMLSGRGTPSELNTTQASSVKKGLPKPKLYGSSRRKQNLSACIRTTPSSMDKSEGKIKKEELTPVFKLERTPDNRAQRTGSLLILKDGQSISDILASIEKDLPTPMKQLLKTPPKDDDSNLLTSTPFKGNMSSPSWASPIHGLTPITGDLMEVAVITPDLGINHAAATTSTPITPDQKVRRSPRLRGISLTPLRSPGMNTPGGLSNSPNSPFKDINNQSFSKLMAEFHLDSLIDEGIQLDVSNMSFSALQ